MPTICLGDNQKLDVAVRRLVAFCDEEFDYYDAVKDDQPERVVPLDVLATFSVNSYIGSASRIRQIHRGLSGVCNHVLAKIPVAADLLNSPQSVDWAEEIIAAAISVRNVLVPVATKVLHRKRPALIPMLDNVILAHYAHACGNRRLIAQSQDKRFAASVGTQVVKLFREDLQSNEDSLKSVQGKLRQRNYGLSLVRTLEILLWTDIEENGYYRLPSDPRLTI